MEPKDLTKVWSMPDNTRLTPKQMSIRLPIHVAARISALCEIFPRKSKTEIIGDLLATALDQLENGLPPSPGDPIGLDSHGEPIFEINELTASDLRNISQKYLRKLEAEMGIVEPTQKIAASLPKEERRKKRGKGK